MINFETSQLFREIEHFLNPFVDANGLCFGQIERIFIWDANNSLKDEKKDTFQVHFTKLENKCYDLPECQLSGSNTKILKARTKHWWEEKFDRRSAKFRKYHDWGTASVQTCRKNVQIVFTSIFLKRGKLSHHLTNLNNRLSAILVNVCIMFSSGRSDWVISKEGALCIFLSVDLVENHKCSTFMISCSE